MKCKWIVNQTQICKIPFISKANVSVSHVMKNGNSLVYKRLMLMIGGLLMSAKNREFCY